MGEITQLLHNDGDPPDLDAVFNQLYPELRSIAVARLAQLAPGQTLTPTSLVNEAYLKLIRAEHLELESRRHFFCCAAKAMRHILVDSLRASGAQKRGNDLPQVTLHDNIAVLEQPRQLLDLDQAMNELEQMNPDQARVVELKFFGGFSAPEIAELLEISERSVWRQWERARAFLHARLASRD